MYLKSILIDKNNHLTHHAYLIEGDSEAILDELFEFFKQSLGVAVKGNPDFLHVDFEVFGIDEGRRLKEMQTGKAFTGDRRFFIVSTSSFTHEAQNSLLKVFEDPSPNVHFFVIMPSADGILPTLRSRFFIIEHESKYKTKKAHNEKIISAKEFLENTSASRLLMIKGIVEEKEKDRALALLNDLEAELHAKLVESVGTSSGVSPKQIAESLEEIGRGKQYIHDRSSSVKLILEHLVLVLPLIKN